MINDTFVKKIMNFVKLTFFINYFRHLTSELNEIIKMIDALMAGEFERCSSAHLNQPLVGTDIEVLEKVSYDY